MKAESRHPGERLAPGGSGLAGFPTAARAIGELADRFALAPEAPAALGSLISLLYTEPSSPTTVREPEAAVAAHLADSLVALELAPVRAARCIADLGSGAGFPGLPLAIALPRSHVDLVESSARKGAFLQRAVTAAANAAVVTARAEDWSPGMGTRDLVTARALGPLAVIAEYAAPLLAMGGYLVAWKGEVGPEEESASVTAAEQLGLRRIEIRRVWPFPTARGRYLYVYLKVRETPERFPRRAGIARKRPLGA